MEFFGSFGDTKANALERLTPVLDSALKAHESGDYALFRSLISDALADKISAQAFRQAHEEIQPQFGELESLHVLAALRRGEDPMLICVARYSKTDDDILIKATFKNATHPPKLDSLWIE